MSGNGAIKIEVQGLAQVKRQIEAMISRVKNLRPLLVDISEIIHAEVEDNFQAGGRDPKWKPSQRVKKHGGQTLINKAGLLSSIQTFVTDTTAGVATNKKYAAIHNFGGEIRRHPFSMSVRLRQNAKGSLPLGITVTVCGTDSETFKQVQRKQLNRRLERQSRNRKMHLTAEEIETEALDMMVACTRGWATGPRAAIELNPDEWLDCTPENIRRVYEELPWLREQIDQAMGDRSLFLKG